MLAASKNTMCEQRPHFNPTTRGPEEPRSTRSVIKLSIGSHSEPPHQEHFEPHFKTCRWKCFFCFAVSFIVAVTLSQLQIEDVACQVSIANVQ